MDRAGILRAGAALFATAAFVGSGSYVVAHPKNDAAPLQPPAEAQLAVRPPAASATPTPRATGRGTPPPRITTAPGVQATQLPGITYTHVS
jgi:hypothetical protein